MRRGAALALGVAVPVLLCVTACFAVMLAYFYSTNPVRKAPKNAINAGKCNASACRIRFVNIQLLPIPYFVSSFKKAKKLQEGGLFDDVDVVFMQEAFSRILLDTTDILEHMKTLNDTLVLACTETPLRSGYFTDCGLVAAATRPWSVKYVASRGFSAREYPCAFAHKGVTVFEIGANPPFRVANTHLQAVSRGNWIQLRQFEDAVEFALSYGAIIIGGDVNVSEDSQLQTMTGVVKRLTGGLGAFVGHDNKPTCCKSKSKGNKYQSASRFDHVWVLDTNKVQTSNITTRDDITDGISDHACLHLTLQIQNGK